MRAVLLPQGARLGPSSVLVVSLDLGTELVRYRNIFEDFVVRWTWGVTAVGVGGWGKGDNGCVAEPGARKGGGVPPPGMPSSILGVSVQHCTRTAGLS